MNSIFLFFITYGQLYRCTSSSREQQQMKSNFKSINYFGMISFLFSPWISPDFSGLGAFPAASWELGETANLFLQIKNCSLNPIQCFAIKFNYLFTGVSHLNQSHVKQPGKQFQFLSRGNKFMNISRNIHLHRQNSEIFGK